MSTFKIDFGAGFDVTESPADKFNIELDMYEAPARRILSGLDADLPGSASEADIYYATDTDKLYIYNGSTWTEVGAGGTGQLPWAIWVPENIMNIGNAAWPTANKALFIPFTVLSTLTVTQVRIHIITSSGNLDIGIYNESRTRLVSLGSTPSPGTGGRVLDIDDTELVAGRYYFAMACDNTTINLVRDTSYNSVLGRYSYENSAFPLPSSVAAFDGSNTNYAPVAVLHISGGIG